MTDSSGERYLNKRGEQIENIKKNKRLTKQGDLETGGANYKILSDQASRDERRPRWRLTNEIKTLVGRFRLSTASHREIKKKSFYSVLARKKSRHDEDEGELNYNYDSRSDVPKRWWHEREMPTRDKTRIRKPEKKAAGLISFVGWSFCACPFVAQTFPAFFTLHGDIPQMISGGLISAGERIKRMEYRHAGILKRKPRKKRVAFAMAGSVF